MKSPKAKLSIGRINNQGGGGIAEKICNQLFQNCDDTCLPGFKGCEVCVGGFENVDGECLLFLQFDELECDPMPRDGFPHILVLKRMYFKMRITLDKQDSLNSFKMRISSADSLMRISSAYEKLQKLKMVDEWKRLLFSFLIIFLYFSYHPITIIVAERLASIEYSRA
ncbi:predicted protein [Chaetoceros tenuissimus]|uniref:Uncharacterized protein n=1 Tax=Chaetoceros tenuissimus TaxID=426638 RepID=A0AAD3HG28_9STRA|nr:predicted protein [Chaetoceros tenuissimus]